MEQVDVQFDTERGWLNGKWLPRKDSGLDESCSPRDDHFGNNNVQQLLTTTRWNPDSFLGHSSFPPSSTPLCARCTHQNLLSDPACSFLSSFFIPFPSYPVSHRQQVKAPRTKESPSGHLSFTLMIACTYFIYCFLVSNALVSWEQFGFEVVALSKRNLMWDGSAI